MKTTTDQDDTEKKTKKKKKNTEGDWEVADKEQDRKLKPKKHADSEPVNRRRVQADHQTLETLKLIPVENERTRRLDHRERAQVHNCKKH